MIFKFNLISKYREELMGYAIFGVLVSHLLMWLDIKIPGVNMVLRLIYTQGFLFLSGFGLYYSLSKSSEILPFYKRRVKRLYIPFALMAFIPFLIRALQFEGSVRCGFHNVVFGLSFLTQVHLFFKQEDCIEVGCLLCSCRCFF